MKLVSENSETDLKKLEASARFEAALEELAINMLRVIAGAGNPGSLLHQMRDCLSAATVYQDAHGYFPAGVASLLDARKYERQQREGWSAEDRARWEADGKVDVDDAALLIRIGSLRVVAAQWAGHRTILSNSEHTFIDAIRRFEDARAERRRKIDEEWQKRAHAKRPSSKPKSPGKRDRP